MQWPHYWWQPKFYSTLQRQLVTPPPSPPLLPLPQQLLYCDHYHVQAVLTYHSKDQRLKYKNENSTINPCSPPYTSILNGWHNLAPRPPLFQKSHTCPQKGMDYLEQNPQGLLGWINQSWSWNLWRWKQMFKRQLTNLVHKIIQLRCLKTHKSCHSHIR